MANQWEFGESTSRAEQRTGQLRQLGNCGLDSDEKKFILLSVEIRIFESLRDFTNLQVSSRYAVFLCF